MKTLTPIILAILLLSFAGISHAQGQLPITAEVDRTTVSTDETVTLTVTLVADLMGAPRPALPSLEGFNVVGSSTSSQLSIVNGNMSSQAVYVYRLQPYETGALVIEPIQVTLNGQTFSTEPITVQVTQGTGAPPAAAPTQPRAPSAPPSGQPVSPAAELAGQDLFVEAVVDNPTPYVGQQVVHTFRFYQAVNLWGQPQYQPPSFKGFWNEHQSEQYEYRAQAAGRIYQVTEIQTVLFPSVVGPVTIEPAVLMTQGSLLRSGKTLQTRPATLEVQPLAPNAPDGFSGAVGQFTLTGTLDTTEGRVNEPLTWQVVLSGRGNLSAAPDPVWPVMSGWRDFESQATVHTEVREGQVVGNRTYERLLVPSTGGEFTIPPLTYTYFDPDAGTYQTISTEPIEVVIAPGAVEEASVALPAAAKASVEQLATDIRHLKPVPHELGVVNQPVTESGLYWAAWAFPVLGAAGYFAWQRRQRYWQNNLSLVRSSQARKKAKRALARARKQDQDAYGAAGQVLTSYLTDKLDRPVAGLTHQALADLLAQRGAGTDLTERVEVVLVSSELGRFAPGADNPDHARSLLREVDILINALEKVL